MAGSVSGQVITSPDLSKVPLLADMQYYEPYSSQGLNRKLRNILQPGIYNGFEVEPGGGLTLKISSTADGGGAISFSIEDRYQISLQQVNDYVLTLTQGTWIVVAQVEYRFGVVTDQVQQNSPYKAAQITYIPTTQAIAANQMELCRVTIPPTATVITEIMIDRSKRVHRKVGMRVTDEVNIQSSDIVASAWAVKKAFDEAQKASASKLGLNNSFGVGMNTIPLAQNFNWQTYTFHGGEYVYIRWSQTVNRPDIDYPDGYYQISVIGLSDTDNQSLLIRPVNYQEPLAPFMISWTGAKGARVFRTRAVMTSQGDINVLNKGPNDLKLKCHVGQFAQPADAQALVSKGYPIAQAGCLFVEPSIQAREVVGGTTITSGVQQRYITYMSNRMYIRGMQLNGKFSGWKEVPNLSNDLWMDGGKVLGIQAVESNRVYMLNTRATLANYGSQKIVGATAYEWYANKVLSGIRRDQSTGTLGYSIEINGAERMRLTPAGEVQAFGAGMAAAADSPAFRFLNSTANTELGKIQIRNNELHLSYYDGTDFALAKHGLRGVGTPTGANAGLISGTTQGGQWASWKTNSAGLLLNAPSDNNAYSLWKAVKGSEQIAAMAVARTNATAAAAYLHVMNVDFKFNSSGLFEAAAATFSGTVTANKLQAGNWVAVGDNDSGLYANNTDGRVDFYANNVQQGYWNTGEFHWNKAINANGIITSSADIVAGVSLHVRSPAGKNRHVFFEDTAGNELGLIYCDDAGSFTMRVAKRARAFGFSAAGDLSVPRNASIAGGCTAGSMKSNGEIRANGNLVIDNAGNKVLYFMQGGTERGVIYVDQANVMRLRVAGGNGPTMIIAANGDITGARYAYFKDVNITSDRRAKRKLKRITSAKEKILALTGYLYEINGSSEDDWQPSGGIIAQDVQKVLPDLVKTDEETGLLRLNYNGLIGLLVEGFKELVEGS